jgi:hypothetical protein
MSKLETNTIDTVSGTSNLTIGGANNTGSTTIKTNNTDAVTIDNLQRVGIGTTSPDTAIDIAGTQPFINIQDTSGAGTGNEYGGITFESSNNNTNAKISSKQDGGTSGGTISLWTQQYATGTGLHERLRVDDNGNTSMFQLNLNITSGSNTANAIRFERNSSIDNDGDVRFVVFGSGNVQNSNNSYAGISDVKLKENIVDATPKLEKLKQVQIRSYNFKDEPDFKQIGVIAQELETVFPNMVEDIPDTDKKGNELGTSTKSVKYSVFVPILIKALQEANSKIEELETRIQTLENN